MYSRLRDGLFGPKSIVDYIKDKWYRPLIQLLFYALIAIIPLVINEINYKGLDYQERVAIRELFDGESINFKTVDGVMTSTTSNTTYSKTFNSMYNIVITSEENYSGGTNYSIVLAKNEIFIATMGFKMKLTDYTSFPDLMNFDFSKLGNQNNTNEWDIVLNAVDKVATSFTKQLIVPSCIAYFIQYIFFLAFTAAIISVTFVTRFRKVIKYSAMYKMSIYYLAPYVVATLIGNIISFTPLMFIGFVVSLIYSIIGASVVMKKLMNQERN